MNIDEKNIILFDGDCYLCSRTIQFISKRDKKKLFNFYPLQSRKGQTLLQNYKLSIYNLDTFVYIKEENAFIKSTAVLQVCKSLGGLWKILFIFIVIPKMIRDYFYDLVAKNRHKLNNLLKL